MVALTVALVGAGGWWGYRSWKEPPKVKYETAKVDRGAVVAKVTATGTLSALVTVQVGSQVSGRIQQLFADFNSPVEAGEVIARIDPALFDAAAAQARANHAAALANKTKAEVQAEDARRQYQRTKALAERKLIAPADLDASLAAFDSARAAVAASVGAVGQAAAALHQAEVNLAYTTIVSPIHGIVISRNVDVGQTVAASLQAPTLFVIAEDLRKMQVDTSVSEADIGKLTAGMDASFAVDAYPAERFSGAVRQIRNAAQTVQNVVTYDVVLDVDNARLALRPGMTANVTFVYAQKDDVLRVPNAALRFRPPTSFAGKADKADAASGAGRAGGEAGKSGRRAEGAPASRTVWRLENEVPVAVSIRTGLSDGSVTEVVEGSLAAGDVLVTDAPAPAGAAAGGGGARRPSGPRLPGF
jgi:HlyD family secretion protein